MNVILEKEQQALIEENENLKQENRNLHLQLQVLEWQENCSIKCEDTTDESDDSATEDELTE